MTTASTTYSVDEHVEHEGLKSRLFPLVEHPLYGSLDSFEDSPYLMPSLLADFTNDTDFSAEATSLEICPACFFNTSGTTNRSKKVPFSDADLDRQRVHEAIALRKLGMGPGDGVMSLGAPMPSISGWAIVNGSEATGARALNTSQIDYDDIFKFGIAGQVTFVIGTPIVVKEIGKAISEEFGPLSECLPNLRTGIIFGDVLPDTLRQELKEIWGFENVYSLYGTVEADVVATESVTHQGEMNLMSERLLFEFLPEEELARERANSGYVPRPHDLANVENGAFGEILISDLSRETLPLIRYRIGDIIQIHRATGEHNVDYPSVSVLGRSKNTVLLSGVALYEMQLDAALKAAYPGLIHEWLLTENADSGVAHYTLAVQPHAALDASTIDPQCLFARLRAVRAELQSVDLDAEIELISVDGFESVEVQGDTKSQRIVLLAH